MKSLQRLSPSRRLVGTAIAFAMPLAVGWYAGYDMLERGESQAFVAFYAFGAAIVT